tara:strand:+ start:964 stop:2232 length:1269 start_codon:yes stop_codon:yes gene_type:complete
MPTANITNPSSLSPNINNDATYTVTWTTAGAIRLGATWKLYISPAASISYTAISSSLSRLSTSFSWTKDASTSADVLVGLDEVATGSYIMKLTYTYRGSESTLDTQTFTFNRRFTSTISEDIEVKDQTQKVHGHKRSRLDSLDINDVIAHNSTAGVFTVLDSLKIQDLTSINRSHRAAIFSELLVVAGVSKTWHRTTIQKTLPRDYIVIKDSINKKILRTSHEGNTDFPMSSMVERIVISDFILFDFASDTKQRMSDQLFIDDELKIILIGVDKSLVYHLDYDAFTKFTSLDSKEFKLLEKGSLKENVNLLVTNSNKIVKFPGDNITDKDGFIETKRLYLEKGVAQRMRLDYEGSLDFIETSTLPLEGEESNQQNYTTNTIQPEKWEGIPQSAGRVRSVLFRIFNADIIKKFILVFKQRIRK